MSTKDLIEVVFKHSGRQITWQQIVPKSGSKSALLKLASKFSTETSRRE